MTMSAFTEELAKLAGVQSSVDQEEKRWKRVAKGSARVAGEIQLRKTIGKVVRQRELPIGSFEDVGELLPAWKPAATSSSLSSIGREIVRFDPVPNALISPYVAAGPAGVGLKIRIGRRPSAVPENSVVGQGLENQTSSGGAEMRARK